MGTYGTKGNLINVKSMKITARILSKHFNESDKDALLSWVQQCTLLKYQDNGEDLTFTGTDSNEFLKLGHYMGVNDFPAPMLLGEPK